MWAPDMVLMTVLLRPSHLAYGSRSCNGRGWHGTTCLVPDEEALGRQAVTSRCCSSSRWASSHAARLTTAPLLAVAPILCHFYVDSSIWSATGSRFPRCCFALALRPPRYPVTASPAHLGSHRPHRLTPPDAVTPCALAFFDTQHAHC